MLIVEDFGQKAQEIASTIVSGINFHGLETTILSLCSESIKRKKLNELKSLIRDKKTISFFLKDSSLVRYKVTIECANGNVDVHPISTEYKLEFNKFQEE